MASDSDKDKAVEFFNAIVDVNGVACSTVSDGHVLQFKTSWLKSILEQYGSKEKITIFIKRPDFKN